MTHEKYTDTEKIGICAELAEKHLLNDSTSLKHHPSTPHGGSEQTEQILQLIGSEIGTRPVPIMTYTVKLQGAHGLVVSLGPSVASRSLQKQIFNSHFEGNVSNKKIKGATLNPDSGLQVLEALGQVPGLAHPFIQADLDTVQIAPRGLVVARFDSYPPETLFQVPFGERASLLIPLAKLIEIFDELELRYRDKEIVTPKNPDKKTPFYTSCTIQLEG